MRVLRGVRSLPAAPAIVLGCAIAMTGCGGGSSSASEGKVTATPTFSPGAGTYNTSQTVTLGVPTLGAILYCTTDGSAPTTSSPKCGQPTIVAQTESLKVLAVAPGMQPSAVATANYVINLNAAATPTFSPAAGSYAGTQNVTISDATTQANIYYTTDGSAPTPTSTLYTGPVAIAQNATLRAMATAPGYSSSGVASANYTITAAPVIPVPSLLPDGGQIGSAQTVSITDAEAAAGTVYYYTTDGSDPTNSSTRTQYSTPFTLAQLGTVTVKAAAYFSGTYSSVVSASFTVVAGAVIPEPSLLPNAGKIDATQMVSITDPTAAAGTVYYYTTDGSDPTSSSTRTQYSAPFTLAPASTVTVEAVASLSGSYSSVVTASFTVAPRGNLTLSGKVMSGTVPVSGAQVQLYGASQAGYGAAATALLNTPATTDSSGAFTFLYACPAATAGDLVYLIASDGSTSKGHTSNFVIMAALGPCNGTLPTSVVVNEVTTVASVYALSQFMTGAANVGSSAANYEQGPSSTPGLANAFATVSNLVDVTTGQARDHTPAYPTNLAGDPNILNNSTVPQKRINTLANALNACAADGSGCSSLFTAATPPGSGAPPTDTLTAILNIAQNPGNNPAPIFNVASTSSAFPSPLSAAPNDWTLALTFTGGGLGFAPGIQVPFLGSGELGVSGQILNSAMAIDVMGNIWSTAFNYSLNIIGSDFTSGMIAKFNNLGAPLTPASTLSSGSSPVPTYGGYIPIIGGCEGLGCTPINGGTLQANGITIDPSGNAWVIGGDPGLSSNTPQFSISVVTAGLSLLVPFIPLDTNNVTPSPVTIDGLGNAWVSTANGLEELDNTGTLQLGPDSGINPPGSPNGYQTLQSLIFDSNTTSLWASDSQTGDLHQINPANDTATVEYFPSSKGVYTTLVAGSAQSDGSAGNVYGCASGTGQSLNVFNSSSTSILGTYAILTGRGCGNQMAMDGTGHIFVVTGGTAPGILDEFSVAGTGVTMVSPAKTGYTGTGSEESPTINPDSNVPTLINNAVSTQGISGAAIDGSGNLWVLNVDTGTKSSPGNALVEFVGIAAPVVTPTSRALQLGQVGVRP